MHWGPPGGLVVLSAHLRAGAGMDTQNAGLLLCLAWHAQRPLASIGRPWATGTGRRLSSAKRKVRTLDGIIAATVEPTCQRPLPGRAIDYAVFGANLISGMAAASALPVHAPARLPDLAEDLELWRRVPVGPRSLPPLRPGCSGPPIQWQDA